MSAATSTNVNHPWGPGRIVDKSCSYHRERKTRSTPPADAQQDRERNEERVTALDPAFEQLVRKYTPDLIRTLTLVVLDREAASEIAQETFIQLYLHWNEVGRHPNMSGWIYKVALNRARDYRRSLSRVARLLARLGSSLPAGEPVDPWRPDVEFLDVLRALSKKQRTAAALHHIGDLSVPEVARIMDISEGTVKSHLYRAHQALKEQLGKGHE